MQIKRWFGAVALACALATAQAQYAPPQPQPTPQAQPVSKAQLIEQGSYTNTDGQLVHRPAHTVNNQIPAGASAQCRDGSYSFSTHHSGTCSHHGGVATWL
jgi:hypothetical protein